MRLWLIAVLFLVGCASTPPVSRSGYSASGRVALKVANERHYAQFDWHQLGEQSELSLSGPLGQTVAELRFSPGLASFKDANQRVIKAASPDALIKEALGWPLPVSGLRWWLRGEADPDSVSHQSKIENGQLLEQAGWRIESTDYRGQPSLPHRLMLSRDDLEIKVVISEWQWNP
ncbi:lipoprotein insertase outer membrane protein LolB [Iodobacter sp. CM08]|uniref:lipoprotein insertase outer membrane protein LolB n=1 Tax=Iodobacter sp. CM08 TaxID=3085902 RepID=UPI002981785A|nr:lipoprotein insertase outer membrane protein LolB [Iodobacter sp. CM08]MDW5418402.1 lipoprotein insertase outer membrane protein LolB [Iodobacter sp. CM08]